jgi:hypothetical protein
MCLFSRLHTASLWEALETFANFKPIAGQPKSFQGVLLFSDKFTHELTEAWERLDDTSSIPGFKNVPENRKKAIVDTGIGGLAPY